MIRSWSYATNQPMKRRISDERQYKFTCFWLMNKLYTQSAGIIIFQLVWGISGALNAQYVVLRVWKWVCPFLECGRMFDSIWNISLSLEHKPTITNTTAAWCKCLDSINKRSYIDRKQTRSMWAFNQMKLQSWYIYKSLIEANEASYLYEISLSIHTAQHLIY